MELKAEPVELEAAPVELGDAPVEMGTMPEQGRFAELLGEVVEASAPEMANGAIEAGEADAKPLRDAVPAAAEDLRWYSLSGLYGLPLTGLTRKSLQRLRLMPISRVRLG